MGNIKALSDELYTVLLDTKKIPELKDYFLVGGTNLALRYNHRVSVDIDLFTPKNATNDEFLKIRSSFNQVFGNRLINEFVRRDGMKAPSFVQFFIKENNQMVKVELVTSFPKLFKLDYIDGIPLLSLKDVGIRKLEAMHERATHKDAYDLDLITEKIPLMDLYKAKIRYRKRLRRGGVFYTRSEYFNAHQLREFEPKQSKVIPMEGYPSVKEALTRWVKKVDEFLPEYDKLVGKKI